MFKSLVALAMAGLGGWLGCTSLAGEQVEFRTVARGTFSGITEPRQEVIREAAAWEKFWAGHVSHTPQGIHPPKIDWGKEMVVAVTLGRRRTGGYSIAVQRIEQQSGTLRVHVQRKSPAPGAMTIQALTAPFHFVAVPKSAGKVEFLQVDSAEKGAGAEPKPKAEER